MPKSYTTKQALEIIVSETDLFDSEGEDINLQLSSDSELSSCKISQTSSFPYLSIFEMHRNYYYHLSMHL